MSFSYFSSIVAESGGVDLVPTMPRRGPGFNRDEIERLLTSIESILPIGGYEWDAVVAQHELYFPDCGRSKDALKRKFSALYGTRIPTGDPTIPPDVLRAKRAYEEIKQKEAEISEGEQDDDNDGGNNDGDEPFYYEDDDDVVNNKEQQQGDQGETFFSCIHCNALASTNTLICPPPSTEVNIPVLEQPRNDNNNNNNNVACVPPPAPEIGETNTGRGLVPARTAPRHLLSASSSSSLTNGISATTGDPVQQEQRCPPRQSLPIGGPQQAPAAGVLSVCNSLIPHRRGGGTRRSEECC